MRIRVVVFGAGTGRQEIEMSTRDMSSGGVLCESPELIPLGKPVRVRLDLTTDSGAPQQVVLEGIALRVDGQGPFDVAFHFVNAPERIREMIRRFVLRSLRPGPR